MGLVQNTAEGRRGFCVDHVEYVVPARVVVGDKFVDGSLEVDDAVLAKALTDSAFTDLVAVGVFLVPGKAKAPAKTAEPEPKPVPAPDPVPVSITPEPKAEGETAVEPKVRGKTK